jgi:hypothetical protein
MLPGEFVDTAFSADVEGERRTHLISGRNRTSTFGQAIGRLVALWSEDVTVAAAQRTIPAWSRETAADGCGVSPVSCSYAPR